jgi:hypothetical protein
MGMQRFGKLQGRISIRHTLNRNLMKHFLSYSLILVTLLLVGCKGEICKDLEIAETTATLSWSGDYVVDGCGFRVQIGEKFYKPENEQDIDASFKTPEPTSVKLEYIPRGKKDFQCGMLPVVNAVDFIRILSIEKI